MGGQSEHTFTICVLSPSTLLGPSTAPGFQKGPWSILNSWQMKKIALPLLLHTHPFIPPTHLP